jgi:Uma2 family endonuclease
MRAFSRKPASYEDLKALPDEVVGELIDGELYVSPRPATRHGLAASVLGSELIDAFHRGRSGPGGWWILFEPELHFGPNALVPDIAGWRQDRLPVLPDSPALEIAPDWVCEVRSPSTARLDLTLKLPKYLAAGVNHAWMVDPADQLLEVFRRDAGGWVLVAVHGGSEKVRVVPFEAIEVDLAALWMPDAPAHPF